MGEISCVMGVEVSIKVDKHTSPGTLKVCISWQHRPALSSKLTDHTQITDSSTTRTCMSPLTSTSSHHFLTLESKKKRFLFYTNEFDCYKAPLTERWYCYVRYFIFVCSFFFQRPEVPWHVLIQNTKGLKDFVSSTNIILFETKHMPKIPNYFHNFLLIFQVTTKSKPSTCLLFVCQSVWLKVGERCRVCNWFLLLTHVSSMFLWVWQRRKKIRLLYFFI